MTQYLLSVHTSEADEAAISEDQIQQLYKQVDDFNEKVKAAGAWVFAGGLHPPSSATVLRAGDGDTLVTDGPYTEGKEHLGGFTVITAPDLDTALTWGGRLADAVAPLPVEVRPFRE